MKLNIELMNDAGMMWDKEYRPQLYTKMAQFLGVNRPGQ